MHVLLKNITAMGLGALLLASCGDGAETAPSFGNSRGDTAVKVIVQPVVFQDDVSRVQAVGTARAKSSADIFPEVSGEVIAVNFEPGIKVERGQALIRLEARAEELAVRRAEVAVRDAEQLIERYERIEVPGAVSDSQVDTARTALEAAKIDLDLARNTLSERVVRAPFSGNTGISNIDPGARVTPQTQITRLDDRSTLFVDFSAPEQVFGGLAPGDSLQMEPFAAPGQTVEASVSAIDSGIDPTTRSFIVRASIDNSDDTLRPGMSFRISFNLPGQSYPTVPETAILYGGDGAYIWTVEDDRVVQTAIDVVAREEGWVLVRGDITPETRVIIEGVQKVRRGSLVDTDTLSREISAAPGLPSDTTTTTR